MEDMKYITEAVARSTRDRLDKRVIVKSVRGKMRKLLLIWLRKTNLPIPQDIHDLIAPVNAPIGQTTPRVIIPLLIEEKEIYKAKYKDLVCIIIWKDEEPEIKIGFKRDFAKGMQNTLKKPKYPLYERLKFTPPLFANSLLFLLAIIISAGGFKYYCTIEDILIARPQLKRKFLIIDWADSIVDIPVFPEIFADRLTE
ncbi:hypothetical protein NA56DRAFT_658879 [Hyaloscypha hepaticicola]|uniref:Uncharacterized protein n=1 Tax=Hyaloscypha hepaticicola TaxID=2082293 RepID=A0A2J6Q4X1_9HELO|nr:hypothetical protein NA56DRAFT_658879 [Hyaloscypha hepaticicola]